MSKHYFAGANTPDGFYSCFNNILPLSKTNKKIYIKGGSGTGKSTLMKRTAALFEEKGHKTETFHCSNDAESIDGISIPDCGIAVVDATAPHPADPQMPVVIDEIFDTAVFLDNRALSGHKKQLIEYSTDKKATYERAYGYLKAARNIHCLNEKIYRSALNQGALNSYIVETLKIFSDTNANGRNAVNRELFATAITPDGLKSLISSALGAGKTYILNNEEATGTNDFLKAVQSKVNLLALDTVSFKCPLEPEKTEHLYIPLLDIAFITSNQYHRYEPERENEKIYFKAFLNTQELEKYKSEIDYNRGIFDGLLQKAVRTMAAAKEIHAEIENIYGAAMDFKKMNKAYDGVLGKLQG
ncbi:MAG: hypothetical protein FWG44_02130 [Oscillospiraceae bacterium]|nr:hypothetical protein [Oscillospiraceae bacterium]